MSPNEDPTVSVHRRGPRCLDSDPHRTLVRLNGEHDIATSAHVASMLDVAVRLDDADVAVDLSGVTFMGASIISTLVVARNDLRASSRSLSVCNPSQTARRLLELCGLADMIDVDPLLTRLPIETALGSWIGVPFRDRVRSSSLPPVIRDTPGLAPALVTARSGSEPARAVARRRAPP